MAKKHGWSARVTKIRIPKIQMAILLILIAISAVLFGKQPSSLQTIGLAVLTAVSVDMALIRLRRIEPFPPNAAMVSGLIIGLLSAPTLPWYHTVAAAVMAMLGKNFLRYKNRHIFNPAAFGLFMAGLLFMHSVSWWGVSFQTPQINPVSVLLFLILLSPGYVSMIRLRRYKILVGFLAAQVLLTGSLQPLFDPTSLFFGLVILPEPMTSPNNHSRQLLFGVFVASVAAAGGFIHSGVGLDPLLTGLLVGNLVFHWIPSS